MPIILWPYTENMNAKNTVWSLMIKQFRFKLTYVAPLLKKKEDTEKHWKQTEKKTFAEERVKSTYIYIYFFFLIEIELSYLKIYFLDDSGSL